AKIEHLHVTITPNHDVLWLNVTMNDSCCMCCCQGTRNLAGYLEHVQQLHARIHPLAQSLTIDKLGGDEPRIACGANLVNCEDVRMIQSRGCLRFLNESLQTLLIGRQPLGKNFDGNR